MNWAEWAVDLAVLGVPPLSCVWAWWLWARQRQTAGVPRWRQVTTVIDLIAFTLSIALGAFALEYWRHFPAEGFGAPVATRVATILGFALAVFGVPFSVLAKSWNRVALVLCSLGLLGFYVGMFAAP